MQKKIKLTMFNIFLTNQYLVLKTISFEATILVFNFKIDSDTKIYNSTYFFIWIYQNTNYFISVIAIFGCQIIDWIWTFQSLMSLFFLGKVKSRKP